MENNLEEIMEETDVIEETGKKTSGGNGVLVAGLIFIAGAATQKYVLTPAKKRVTNWWKNRKTKKGRTEVIDDTDCEVCDGEVVE